MGIKQAKIFGPFGTMSLPMVRPICSHAQSCLQFNVTRHLVSLHCSERLLWCYIHATYNHTPNVQFPAFWNLDPYSFYGWWLMNLRVTWNVWNPSLTSELWGATESGLFLSAGIITGLCLVWNQEKNPKSIVHDGSMASHLLPGWQWQSDAELLSWIPFVKASFVVLCETKRMRNHKLIEESI